MLNAHFKSSGFNKTERNPRDLRMHIEQPAYFSPEVRDMNPSGGWLSCWRRLVSG